MEVWAVMFVLSVYISVNTIHGMCYRKTYTRGALQTLADASAWKTRWPRPASAGTQHLWNSRSWKGKERQIAKALSMEKSPQAAEQLFNVIVSRGANLTDFHFNAMIHAWVVSCTLDTTLQTQLDLIGLAQRVG